MAKPPISPMTITINDKEKDIDYFEFLVLKANDIMKKDGIKINIKGYKETVEEYKSLQENDLEKMWTLAKDLNAWSEYLSGLCNLIQKYYLDSETKKAEVLSIVSINADQERVTNGKRLADQHKDVILVRQHRNTLQSFYNELEAKVKFLERAHYHCKTTYDNSIKRQISDNTPKEANKE